MHPLPPLSPRRLCRAALDWLLPCHCALCGHPGDAAVCAPCRRRYVERRAPRCLQCALPLPAGPGRCGACLRDPPAFDATVAACDYAAPADELVLALKFGGRLALAPWFAAMIAGGMQTGDTLPDLLVAVPLGRARLAARGFNQALEIARPLGRRLGVPIDPHLLVRVRDTAPQALLPLRGRAANLRHAFALAPHGPALVRGRHVGIVDDVLTTGGTLGEAAALLKRYGAARVTSLVFARTALN